MNNKRKMKKKKKEQIFEEAPTINPSKWPTHHHS
jgi:hypothetical protein